MKALLSLALLILVSHPVAADDWPQWRGPDRDGKSAETGLLQDWPEGGPPLAWQASGLGAGYASVSIAGGKIFTMGDLEGDVENGAESEGEGDQAANEGEDESAGEGESAGAGEGGGEDESAGDDESEAGDDGGQYVLALAEDGGELLWKTRVGDRHEAADFGGARSTPTVDGGHLYLTTTEGDVVCLDAETGEERWRRSLVKDFEGYLMRAMGSYEWRFVESPLVDGDKVIVTPGHIRALMVALNKETGEEVWRTAGTRLGPIGADGAGYSSAVVSEAMGVRQVVQFYGRGVIGVDAGSGELLWGYNRVANDIANIPTPIVDGNYVFASSGYGTGAALLEIVAGEEDGLEAKEIYFLEGETFQNHHGGMILVDGTVYTGTGHNKGFPIALDMKAGKVLWGPERTEGRDSSAIVYGDGRIYFRFRDGRMILVEANPESYVERGTFMIPDVEKESWSHPAIANGKLYLREQDNLYCYDVKAPAEAEPEPAQNASAS